MDVMGEKPFILQTSGIPGGCQNKNRGDLNRGSADS